jgi:hypothetical protein
VSNEPKELNPALANLVKLLAQRGVDDYLKELEQERKQENDRPVELEGETK